MIFRWVNWLCANIPGTTTTTLTSPMKLVKIIINTTKTIPKRLFHPKLTCTFINLLSLTQATTTTVFIALNWQILSNDTTVLNHFYWSYIVPDHSLFTNLRIPIKLLLLYVIEFIMCHHYYLKKEIYKFLLLSTFKFMIWHLLVKYYANKLIRIFKKRIKLGENTLFISLYSWIRIWNYRD